MRATFLLLILGCVQLPRTIARSWTVIDPFHTLSPVDDGPLEELLRENDPLFFTLSPTASPPSAAPSTSEPSESPSSMPTITAVPTSKPTRRPPTMAPTNEPTTPAPTTPAPVVVPYFPPIPPPQNPGPDYFNYDYRSISQYGPGNPQLVHINATTFEIQFRNNGWARVATQHYSYWKEFGDNGFGPWKGILSIHNVDKNMCGNSGMQSPIDLRPTPDSRCYETHQVRARSGDLHLTNDEEIIKEIGRNKLRLLYARRPCRSCREPDPPLADFPNDWPGLVDLLHIDFKIPSEHTIEGERFDGEMQLMYLHPGRMRVPSVAVTMKATKTDHNPELQRALDEFQQQYDRDYDACVGNLNRARRMGVVTNKEAEEILSAHSELDRLSYRNGERILQANVPNTTESPPRVNWDPHHPLMIPSVHFYGYEGSITEPPCGEFVSWRVMDAPMLISFEQLNQMKRLIFTHLSPQCRRTSVHYNESVARPVQDIGDRDVWRCTPEDWPRDS